MITLVSLGVALQTSSSTSTTQVPKIVGDPLPTWVVLAAGFALFVVVLAGGLWLRRRARGDTQRAREQAGA